MKFGSRIVTRSLGSLLMALVFIHTAGSCQSSDADQDAMVDLTTDTCSVLFGLPNDKTGLTAQQCRPACECPGHDFAPPVYSEADQAALLAMVNLTPFSEVITDPYADPEGHPAAPAGLVCGLVRQIDTPGGYRLHTYPSIEAAFAAGAYVTHHDGCGVCSSLMNLVVYMRHPDLTDPVRQCGLANFGHADKNIACLQDLGFDLPCAQVWYYNTKHTQTECLQPCMAALDAPYHLPDGTLNDCLRCDEEKSGPVFKAVAGRTRRNTGLPSSMCRPCDEVLPVVHDYGE